jgi:formimidoylglutamate deiminase
MDRIKCLTCRDVLLPEGWGRDVTIELAADGTITAVTASAPTSGNLVAAGPVVPGMPNLHSHGFQRGMAGTAEVAAGNQEDFWSWRETMYRFVADLDPDDVTAVCSQLDLDLLRNGYTSLAEFHYLHHDPNGHPYDRLSEMSHRVIGSAKETGLGITLLPVLYAHGGFGGQPPRGTQRRFATNVDQLLRIVSDIRSAYPGDPQLRVGLAAHSLRAVTKAELNELLEALKPLDRDTPIHLHIAEQQREVEQCLAELGARPVEWLLDRFPVDSHWCLVHATHMTEAETNALARSQAVVGLCPTTEANLGDGIFAARQFLAAGGRFGIGSDSHVSVSPTEELRLLETTQRLLSQKRHVLGPPGRSVGAFLYRNAVAGGASALGRRTGRIAPGYQADLVVLNEDHPLLSGRKEDQILDSYVFCGGREMVRDVIVGGCHVICNGHHVRETEIESRFRAAVGSLFRSKGFVPIRAD